MATGALILDLDLVGLRGAEGRFAKADETLRDAKLAIMPALKDAIEAAFHNAAPYYEEPPGAPPRIQHFRDSFHGDTDIGEDVFTISISTDQGDLANWLAAGSYPIHAKPGKNLHFYTWEGEWFRMGVEWRTSHSEWEFQAEAESAALARAAGGKIVGYVVTELTFGG